MYNQWQNQNYNMNSMNTNLVRVTSLEDAIMRTNQYGSEMVYFHQDKNVFYLVRMDINGRKTWQEFPYTVPDQNNSIPATKADMQTLIARIEALEAKLGAEVNVDAQPIGQHSV